MDVELSVIQLAIDAANVLASSYTIIFSKRLTSDNLELVEGKQNTYRTKKPIPYINVIKNGDDTTTVCTISHLFGADSVLKILNLDFDKVWDPIM